MTTDLLARARTTLAAASTCAPDVATHYVAAARAALNQATEEIREIEFVLGAREAQLGTVPSPKEQGT